MSKYAIVFVANDGVYDQTVAFLESLRQNSPDIPCVCIPYNENMKLIKDLSLVYDFTIHDDFDFRAFMEISTIMVGRPLERIRKLGAFTVPVDEFISLDTDIIVLHDLSPLFGHVGKVDSNVDVLHFDLSPNGTYWLPDHALIAHSKEINTGAFVSSKRIFDYEHHVTTIMNNYTAFKQLAVVENDDQPFGSFVFDIDRRRYASVETVSDFSEHSWYKKDFEEKNGVLVMPESGREIALLHYAGVTRGEGYAFAECFREIALRYQREGMARVTR